MLQHESLLQVTFHYVHKSYFIYSFIFMDVWVFFGVLSVMNNIDMNILVQAFLWTYVFTSFGCILRRRIVVCRECIIVI